MVSHFCPALTWWLRAVVPPACRPCSRSCKTGLDGVACPGLLTADLAVSVRTGVYDYVHSCFSAVMALIMHRYRYKPCTVATIDAGRSFDCHVLLQLRPSCARRLIPSYVTCTGTARDPGTGTVPPVYRVHRSTSYQLTLRQLNKVVVAYFCSDIKLW